MEEKRLSLGKELGRFDGETFYIAEHEFGALYHVYNSMEIAVNMSQTSLYETLIDLVRNKDVYEKLEGEEKKNFELSLSAMIYILDCPLYSFSSIEFTFSVAETIIKQLRLIYEKAMGAELQEETKEEDKLFENAAKAIETLKKDNENGGSESKGKAEEQGEEKAR